MILEQLTDTNFQQYIRQGTAVIDFYADWCGPCNFYAPTFADVAAKYPAIKFAKVNIDASRATARRYGVNAIPTTILFHDGQEVARQLGAMNKPDLERFVQQ